MVNGHTQIDEWDLFMGYDLGRFMVSYNVKNVLSLDNHYLDEVDHDLTSQVSASFRLM